MGLMLGNGETAAWNGGGGGGSHAWRDLSILTATREALDGPNWRVLVEGKLVPTAWHHEKIISDCQNRARAPTPYPLRPEDPSASGGEVLDDSVSSESERSCVLTDRQRNRQERKGRRRQLADLYLQAKQGPGSDKLEDAQTSLKELPAGLKPEPTIQVPTSSLKETSNDRYANLVADKKLGILGARGLEAIVAAAKQSASCTSSALLSRPGSDVHRRVPDHGSDVTVGVGGQDSWDSWLDSIAGEPARPQASESDEAEEDSPSDVSFGADSQRRELGPQDTSSADRQLDARGGQPGGSGATHVDSVLYDREETAWRDDESHLEQEIRQEAQEVADMVMKSQNNRTAIATEDDSSNGAVASEKEVPEAKSRWQAEGPRLAQHLVSVKNVAGNTVHVIGAAVEASAPATPHRHQASLPVDGVQYPHPSPDDDLEQRAPWEAPAGGGRGILARSDNGAVCFVTAEVIKSRTVGGETAAGGRGEVYTVFVLSCQGGGVVWHVSRRYSEFAELHLKLLALLPAAKGGASRARAALIARMPAKVYLGATAPEVVKHRLDLLTSYVLIVQRTLLQHGGADDPNPHASGQSSSPTPPSPPSWVTQACKVWQQFCAVPSTAFAAAALARSAQPPLAARPSSPPVATRVSSPTGGGGGGAGQLRSVLRRGPKAKTNKKVAVEEGRQQVVWGNDGVLQIDTRMFIAGTPQRTAREKPYKHGAPKLVNPAGPFKIGWWEDQEELDTAEIHALVVDSICDSTSVSPAALGMAEEKTGEPGGEIAFAMPRSEDTTCKETRPDTTPSSPQKLARRRGEPCAGLREDALFLAGAPGHIGEAAGSDTHALGQEPIMGHAKLRELKKPSPITDTTEEALPLCTQRQFSRERELARPMSNAGQEDMGRLDLIRALDQVALGHATESVACSSTPGPGGPALSAFGEQRSVLGEREIENGRGNDRPRLDSKQRGLAAAQAAAALSSVSAGADGEAGATDVAGRRAVRAGSWMSMGGYGCVAGSSDVATATRPAKPVLVAVEDTLAPEGGKDRLMDEDDDLRQVEQALKKAQEAVSTSTASTVMPSLDPNLLTFGAGGHSRSADTQLMQSNSNEFESGSRLFASGAATGALVAAVDMTRVVKEEEEEDDESVGLSASELEVLHRLQAPAERGDTDDLETRLSLLHQVLAKPTTASGASRSSGRSESSPSSSLPLTWKALPPLSPCAQKEPTWKENELDSKDEPADASIVDRSGLTARPPRDDKAAVSRWSAAKSTTTVDAKGKLVHAHSPAVLELPPLPKVGVLAAKAAEECTGDVMEQAMMTEKREQQMQDLEHVAARLERRDFHKDLSRSLNGDLTDAGTLHAGEDGSGHIHTKERDVDRDLVWDGDRQEAIRQLRLWNQAPAPHASEECTPSAEVPDSPGRGHENGGDVTEDVDVGERVSAKVDVQICPGISLGADALNHADPNDQLDEPRSPGLVEEVTPGWGSEPVVEIMAGPREEG